MGTTVGLGLRWADLASTAKGPEATMNLANDVEAAYRSVAANATNNPTWSATGTGFVAREGWYRNRNGWCDFGIQVVFGSSTTGGRMSLQVALPVAASALFDEQVCEASYYQPQIGHFKGQGRIMGGTALCRIAMPASLSLQYLKDWQHANAAGTSPGTGVPLMPSNAVVYNGGWMCVGGRYMV